MKWFTASALMGLFLGIVAGKIFLGILPTLPLSNHHPLFLYFGLRRPEVVGFLPYFLLDRAKSNYSDKLTILAYFSLTVNPDGTLQKLVNNQEEEPGWTWLKGDTVQNKLKEAKQAGLKTSLLLTAIDEDTIAQLLTQPSTSADTLVAAATPLVAQYGFDDVNLDIESFVDTTDERRQAFTNFITRVAQGLRKGANVTVTFDLVPDHLYKKRVTDPAAIGKVVDTVILMGYDFHNILNYLAGPVSPIYGAKERWGYDLDTALKLALAQIPREKLILGTPLYGYEWETLTSEPGAPVIPGTGAAISSQRIADFLSACASCSAHLDTFSREPYVIYQDGPRFHQVFFVNEASLKDKLAVANKHQLAGVALWALGYEDESMMKPLTNYKQAARWLE